MRKNLPGDKNPLLHTNPYDLNKPLKKTDTGEKNADTYFLRYHPGPGIIHGAKSNTTLQYGFDRHHLTPRYERQWALHNNDEARR